MPSPPLARPILGGMSGWHVAVSGLMGAGKTTLVKGLAREFGGAPLVERDADNPYLPRFYLDPSAWAFQSFVFFLQQTLADYCEARSGMPGGVQERVLEEHLVVFGSEFRRRGYLSEPDLKILGDLTATAARLVRPPDLLIHLDIGPHEALRRLRQREAATGEDIQLDYLEALSQRYELLLSDWRGEILRLDAESYDFRNDRDVAELAVKVDELLDLVGAE